MTENERDRKADQLSEETELNNASLEIASNCSDTSEKETDGALDVIKRLSLASENLDRIDQKERLRKEEEMRRIEERRILDEKLILEAEERRALDEKTAESIARERLEAFKYAENYRKKMQRGADREAEEKRLLEKEERERAAQEASEKAIEEELNAAYAESLEREARYRTLFEDLASQKNTVAENESQSANRLLLSEALEAHLSKKSEDAESTLAEQRFVLNVIGGVASFDEDDKTREDERQTIEIYPDNKAVEEQISALENKEEDGEIIEPPEPVLMNDASVLAIKEEGGRVGSLAELLRYLKYSGEILKTFEDQKNGIERELSSREDENDAPAMTVEILNALSKILEILCDNLSVASRIDSDKHVRKITLGLVGAIDEYNEYVMSYLDLTGQQLTRVSASTPKDIVTGTEVVIPELSYRESFIELYLDKDGASQIEDSNLSTVIVAPAISKNDIIDAELETYKDVRNYCRTAEALLKKLSLEQKRLASETKRNSRKNEGCLADEKRADERLKLAIAALDTELSEETDGEEYRIRLLEIREKYEKSVIKAEIKTRRAAIERKNLKLLAESLAIEREKLDCLCIILSSIRSLGTDKEVAYFKKRFVDVMLEHNRLSDLLASSCEGAFAKVEENLADEVLSRGCEVVFPKIAYRRELVETVGDVTRIVGDRLKSPFADTEADENEGIVYDGDFAPSKNTGNRIYEIEQLAVDYVREDSAEVDSKKTLRRFLFVTGATVRRFRTTLRQTERMMMRVNDESSVIALLVECLRIGGKYAEVLAIRLSTMSSYCRGRRLDRERRALSKVISKFNHRAIDYYKITGDKISGITASSADSSQSGALKLLIPSISYKENYIEVHPRQTESAFAAFNDILNKRKAGCYIPVDGKNRRLTENNSVSATPINPPRSASELDGIAAPHSFLERIACEHASKSITRRLDRRLGTINRRLCRLDKRNSRFDKRLAILSRRYSRALFIMESTTDPEERTSISYQEKLQNENNKFTYKAIRIEMLRTAAAIDRNKMKLNVERFVVERERFAVASENLKKLRFYGKKRIVAEAKNELVKAMEAYNRSAGACSSYIGESISRISSSVAEELVRQGAVGFRLPKIVCFTEIIETVNGESRTVGEHKIDEDQGVGKSSPFLIDEEVSRDNGYELSYVNDEIALLEKYRIAAIIAKGEVVDGIGDYFHYALSARKLISEINSIAFGDEAIYSFVKKALRRIKDMRSDSENRTYRYVKKQLLRIALSAARHNENYVERKARAIISELDEMRTAHKPVSEAVDSTVRAIEKDLLSKLDLDVISAVGKIVEIRAGLLKAAVKLHRRRLIHFSRKALTSAVMRYNECVSKYSGDCDGERLSHIPILLPDNIIQKGELATIPEILYNKRFAEQKKYETEDKKATVSIDLPAFEEIIGRASQSGGSDVEQGVKENDNTIIETVDAPLKSSAKWLLSDAENSLSPRRFVKASKYAISYVIDKRLFKSESKLDNRPVADIKRSHKIYKATLRYDKAILRASEKATGSGDYQRMAGGIFKRYSRSVYEYARRYPAPELITSKRAYLERFALVRERLIIAAMALRVASDSDSPRLLSESKHMFLESVTIYNKEADRLAIEIGIPVSHAKESWVDTIVYDKRLPAPAVIVYKRDLIEVVGSERKTVGEKTVRLDGRYILAFENGKVDLVSDKTERDGSAFSAENIGTKIGNLRSETQTDAFENLYKKHGFALGEREMLEDELLKAQVKAQSIKDLKTLGSHFDREIRLAESYGELPEVIYGRRESELSQRKINSIVSRIRRNKEDALESEARDNSRYYSVVLADPMRVRTQKPGRNRRRLALIRERVIALLNERDDLNSLLEEIYSQSGRPNTGSHNAPSVIADSTAPLLRYDSRGVNSFLHGAMSSSDRDRLQELLDMRDGLLERLAFLEKRKKTHRGAFGSPRYLKRDIKECKRDLKLLEGDIERFMNMARAAHKNRAGTWFAGIVIFLFVCAVGFLCGYAIKADPEIFDGILKLFGK